MFFNLPYPFVLFIQDFKDKAITRKILNFMVHCGFKGKGCEWTGELRSFQVHYMCYRRINFFTCYVDTE